MLKSNLNSSESQIAVGNFFVQLLQTAGNTGIAPTPAAALALASATLGGGARAGALVQAFAGVFAYADTPLPHNSNLLDEENLATTAANQIILPIEAMRFQALIDSVEVAAEGTAKCPEQGCGNKAHSHGRIARTFTGRHGKMGVHVRQCICVNPACAKIFSPACLALGLSNGKFTPGCAEVVTMFAASVPHGKAMILLGEALQIDVSEHAVQDLVQARAEVLLAQDLAEAEAHNHQDSTGLARSYTRPQDAVSQEDAPDVAYLEVDGVFPMTREKMEETSVEVAGARGGKGRKYKCEGREVKNAVFYKGSDHAQEMPSRGCILQRRYVSYLGNYKVFALLVWLTMLKLRFDQAKMVVVLSDGCDWIRTLAKWLPIGKRFKLILDLFHAKHRIWEVAAAVYGTHSDKCRELANTWCEAVEAGGVKGVLEHLGCMLQAEMPGTDKIKDLITYFDNNQDRMDYPAYKLMGLRISSGIVESANFHVTGARLKQQGMRWAEKGAREMAMLRADLCNGLWSQRTRQLLPT